MRPLALAIVFSLLGHWAIGEYGASTKDASLVRAPAPFVWLEAPPPSRTTRGKGPTRIRPGPPVRRSSVTSESPRNLPQWTALGDLLALGNRPPEYPAEALTRAWEGTVRVRVEFGEKGSAERVAVESSSGYGSLDNAAVEAARQWKIEGGGTRRSLIVPVSFQLFDEG